MADDASTSQVPSGLQSQSDLLLLVQDMRQQLATLTGQQNRQVLAPKQVDEESEAGSESEQEEGEATSGDEQGGIEASENEDFSDESENQNIFARYHSQHKKKTDDGACHQQITRLPSGERTVKPLMVICNVSSVC